MEGEITSLFSASSAIVAALLTGLFTWYAATRKGREEYQSNLNVSFRDLINELQQERVDARREIHDLRTEIQALRGDIHRLQNHIQTLEDILRSHNIKFQPYLSNKQ